MESLTFCYYMPVVPVLIEDNMPLLSIEFQATSEIASEKEKQITMSFQYTSDLLPSDRVLVYGAFLVRI